MFKDIKYLSYKNSYFHKNDVVYTVRLIDDDFETDVNIHTNIFATSMNIFVLCLIIEYYNRNLLVADNVALYYLDYLKSFHISSKDLFSIIYDQMRIIEKHYPQLRYELLYYNQVIESINNYLIFT